MHRNINTPVGWAALFALTLSACNGNAAPGDQTVGPSPQAETKQASAFSLTVYKSPTCDCCTRWAEHLAQQGIVAEILSTEDLSAIKSQYGISSHLASCHTAVSAQGFVFEGHVPARFIRQFMANPPEGSYGLAVPGMPLGSPGMEMGDRFFPYQVFVINRDGTTEPYATIHSPTEQYENGDQP